MGEIVSLRSAAVFMGVLILWASAQASAPLCRDLFSKDDLLIQNLAHLRLELDLDQVHGSNSDASITSLFASQYDQAFSAFMRSRNYTEAQLKALIKQELLNHQGKQNKILDAEREARDEAQRAAAIYMPKPLGTEFTSLATIENKISFIDSHRTLVFMQRGELKFYRFDENKTDSIADVSAFDFNPVLGKVLFLSKHYELYEYDLFEKQRKLIAKVPAGLDPQRLKMELSPSGDKFVLYLDDRAEIFDSSSGRYLGATDISYGTTLAQTIRNLRFLNDDQIVFDGGMRLFKFNISSKTREILKTLVSSIGRWELAANREYVVIESKRDVEVVKLDNNSSVDGKIGYFPNEKSNRNFSFIQGSNQPLVFFRHSDRLGIYDLTSLSEPLFNFGSSYTADTSGSRNLINMTVSENGKKAVVIFQDSGTEEIWAEFWPLPYN